MLFCSQTDAKMKCKFQAAFLECGKKATPAVRGNFEVDAASAAASILFYPERTLQPSGTRTRACSPALLPRMSCLSTPFVIAIIICGRLTLAD